MDQKAEEQLVKECQRRFKRADMDKQRHRTRLDDCYRLALPWRTKMGQTQQDLSQLDDIFDSTALEVVEDFASDMLNTFTPVKSAWVELQPATALDSGAQNQIARELAQYQKVLFAEMARSSLYQALQEAYLDLGPGTMALIIQDRHPSEPIHVQAIPVTELWIDRGPWGEVDGRFRKFRVRAADVGIMWPKANLANLPGGSRTNADTEIEVTEHLYRDWSERGTEAWHYVVTAGSKLLIAERFTGRGSCPIVVARWSRDSSTAWGVGPTYRSLPDIKTLNYVRERGLKSLDKAVDPVTTYDDDGVINVSGGVVPGDWIPKAPGSKVEVLESAARFDVTWMEIDDIRQRIRRAHYQDRPEQQGKTPPTATQWADEAAERARRMGTPATNLVLELQYPVVERFAYLLAKRGVLQPVKLNGQVVNMTPVSPLLRAQEQEAVIRVDRFLELIVSRFGPEALNIIVDQVAVAEDIAKAMGVSPKFVRTQAEVQQLVQAASAAAQSQQGAPA